MSVEYDRLMLKFKEENRNNKNKYIEDIYKVLEQDKVDEVLIDSINNNCNGEYWIIQLIRNIFDSTIRDKYKEQFLNRLLSEGIKIIKYNKKTLILEYNDKQISVGNLHSNFKQFDKNIYNQVNYIPILINKIRELNHNAKIVIGYVKQEALNSRKLLAWIEIQKNTKSYVIDLCDNIVIDKDSFYMFYKPEVLNEVKKEEVISDELLSFLVNDLSVQYDEYLIFDKAFKKDIQKNKELF